MKKLGIFVMPLMVISLLASCGTQAARFTVTFDTDGGSYIESQKVSCGEKVTKPDNPTKKQTDIYTFDFNEWQLDGSIYDFNTPVTKDITLKAVYDKKARHYTARANNENNLIFTTLDDVSLIDIDITAGQVFKFKVKADNTTNSDHYIVPSILNISIKGMDPLVDGYRVQTPGEEESEVTIDANKVIGDIVISGTAANDGKFNYQVSSHYGLKEIGSDSAPMTDPLTLTFTPEGSYTKPKAENIYVYFDEAEMWITPADDGVGDEYCSYDYDLCELTIKTTHILNSIDIKAQANNYKLLNSLTWGKINELSTIGAAPYVFYIGEEKTVEVNTKIHTVRIIDFNKDVDPDGNNLGITFEFANVITGSNGNAVTTIWDGEYNVSGNNFDYRKSVLNNFLNDDILNMLPSSGDQDNPDLREVIKPVDKKVGVSLDGGQNFGANSFDGKDCPYPYLFPLAHDEITADREESRGHITPNEGDRYEYYLVDPEVRIKKKAGASSDTGDIYWLRSPSIVTDYNAWHVDAKGVLQDIEHIQDVYKHKFAVAPAFCI